MAIAIYAIRHTNQAMDIAYAVFMASGLLRSAAVTAKQRVALIAGASNTRDIFAAYLRDAGFDVHVTSELGIATAFTGVVLIDGPEDAAAALVTHVRARIRATRTQRVVVVTSKPAVLNDLAIVHGDRLVVLAAPVFGWHVVDALRGGNAYRPRTS